MSTFKALNIESDSESEISVDDTKEIQIEDALKLYQNALQAHAKAVEAGDWPAFEEAGNAYAELFASDIFQWPESQTELRRIELYGPTTDDEIHFVEDVSTLALLPLTGSGEAGPSTLPQILHLAHKNFAQFKLEALSAKFDALNVSLQQLLADASAALEHFVEALDKDDGDLDLWKRTATVGELLESQRIVRFCLEAVLDGDDDAINDVLALPGLQDTLAGEKLRELVAAMSDSLSLLQTPRPAVKPSTFQIALRQRLSPYADVQRKEKALVHLAGPIQKAAVAPGRVMLKAPKTWAQMGELLLSQRNAQQQSGNIAAGGSAIGFEVSSGLNQPNHEAGSASSVESVATPEQPATMIRMPTTVQDVFPGLDSGKPTVQPSIADADVSMAAISRRRSSTVVSSLPTTVIRDLPSRKRSGDTAGLGDRGDEEGRTKSKRIRARDSMADSADTRQAIIDANTKWEYEQQLNEYQAADDWMFETVGAFFERIGVVGFNRVKDVRQQLEQSDTYAHTAANVDLERNELCRLRQDLNAFLDDFSEPFASLLLVGGDQLDVGKTASVPGSGSSVNANSGPKALTKPELMPNEGIETLQYFVNSSWLQIQDVAYEWIFRLLHRNRAFANSYTKYQWSEELKTMVVRTLVNFDEEIFKRARSSLREELSFIQSDKTIGALDVIQSIFELHLDVYCLIKETNSGVDADTISCQGDRLIRWSELAREGMQACALLTHTSNMTDELSLRFLWATTFHIAAVQDVSQDHVIECMQDLRQIFLNAGEPTIVLHNNAIMPELSVVAIDRELSRLTTKDFFLKVTSQSLEDPVAVIESVEPLLDALEQCSTQNPKQGADLERNSQQNEVPAELVQFVQNSSLSVRLLLWQRLKDAYVAIDFKGMTVICYFRMMRLLLSELKKIYAEDRDQNERLIENLKTLRLLQDYISRIFRLVQESISALDCMDERSLQMCVDCLGEILLLLQVFTVFEDSIRVGQNQAPSQSSGLPLTSYTAVMSAIHDSQLHIWMILYSLLQEAIKQNPDLYPTAVEDKFDFLRCVHRNMGIRAICGASNRALVRMLKDEFFTMTHVDGYDTEQAQVLYDLYGLNCFLNPSYELIEHHCTRDAFLDRGVALQAVDLLLSQASKLPVKELIKHPLKDTIEKVHGAAPRKKATDVIMRNKEICRARIRQPINPVDLYACLKGEGNELPATPVPQSDVALSSKGWHFLMGHMSLAKFKSVKRTQQTSTEELDIAIAFFTQDQEHSMEKWETWFRVGQTYDAKIEESIKWSAEKMNNNKDEILKLERNAINCYTMAMALAYRSADLTFENSDKFTELYVDFATRLYSSSRDPLSMQAFGLEDLEKFLSTQDDSGKLPKIKPFQPLRLYTCWKLAKTLFQRALPGRPRDWMLRFQLGKVLWKMHSASSEIRKHDVSPTAREVLKCFVATLELIPDKKDNRDAKREPILEPHYKLVSIAHKMIMRGSIGLEEAKAALGNTHYASNVEFPDNSNGWTSYILAVMQNLRAADKSNWHHRMINRSAQIIYHATNGDVVGAQGAKNEYTKQMFTKTMVLQVWRPESERPGRHFVYTSRYTRFLTRVLEQLGDRANLEQLARRVRRRPHDLFEHSMLWQEICTAYLRLLRAHAELPEGLETATFSNIAHEDFLARKEPLELWMQKTESTSASALEVLREVQELKKINQGLMRPGPIDDLIGDAYALLFNSIGKQLYEGEQKVKQEEEAQRKPPTPPPPPVPAASPPRNPAMSLSHLMNSEGTSDNAARPAPFAAPGLASTPATVVPASDPPARRKIGVGRREIRTAAEACFQKAGALKAGDKLATPSNVRVEVVINSSRPSLSGEASVDTSAPGSIHDSADDESELSELEEENDDEETEERELGFKRRAFPNLEHLVGDDSRAESEAFETADEGDEGEQDGEQDEDDGNGTPVRMEIDQDGVDDTSMKAQEDGQVKAE